LCGLTKQDLACFLGVLALAAQVLAQIDPPLHRRPRSDRVAPAGDVGELIKGQTERLFTGFRVNGRPVSSSMMETFQPFGVGQ
jgi:hypothetical protein